jgi:NAD-dependent dihydropyrimidine dehydrogenase PreA subunit
MKRKIIKIDEAKCNGCGLCIPECPEGALQVIDGKARLVRDLFCDGLGACLGHCPEGAITIEERNAEAYDERIAMANIVKLGRTHIDAHLQHLKEHGESVYLGQALDYLREQGFSTDSEGGTRPEAGPRPVSTGCPGLQSLSFGARHNEGAGDSNSIPSSLTHWPIQLHLINPAAPHFQNADLLLAADCVAFSRGDFHPKYLAGRSLVIACPKLDDGQEEYLSKLRALIDQAGINTLTVMIMQVPCCSGLLSLARQAAAGAARKVQIRYVVVGIKGDILKEGIQDAICLNA